MVFPIRNPVLRFFAGLVMLVAIIALAAFLALGVGSLMEPWYAQQFPFLYAHGGFSTGDAILHGFGAICVLVALIVVLVLWFNVARALGNRFFRPSE